MSNEAFDRAVRALEYSFGYLNIDDREMIVRTVLEAVRYPTPWMRAEGVEELIKEDKKGSALRCWQAMVDELLKP